MPEKPTRAGRHRHARKIMVVISIVTLILMGHILAILVGNKNPGWLYVILLIQ